MILYARNPASADRLLGAGERPWHPWAPADRGDLEPLVARLFGEDDLYRRELEAPGSWAHLFFVEVAPGSHFDLLVDLSRDGRLPAEPLLCLAGEGRGFHGMRGRPWASAPGNIHLAAHFGARAKLDAGGVAIAAAAALAVVEALDDVLGLEGLAGIKWVNDILIGGAKVAGVLAHTNQVGDEILSAVIGIGIDVETRPTVAPTPYVPRVASIAEVVPCQAVQVLVPLLDALDRHCQSLIAGGHRRVIEAYRRRSLVLGREVRIDSESGELLARGRVAAIGEHLELILEGEARRVAKGRLVMEDAGGGSAP